MSTFLHGYELEGVKESVANFISNISPSDTPFSSMTRKVKETNTLFQWLTDQDAVPTATTGVLQGADVVLSDMSEPVMLSSYTQIFSKGVKVDGTSEAMGLYGRGKPMAYQLLKKGREMKREIEMTLLSGQSGAVASGIVTGKLDGVGTRRNTNGTPAINTIVNGATAKTFSEEELQSLLLKLWKAGANPSVIMFPAEYAKQFSALREQGSATNMFDGEVSVDVNRKVETYVDPLGQRLKLVVNRYMPEDTIYVLDPSMFEQHILRNFQTEDKASTGDYKLKQLLVELGLANKNPLGSGIYNLTGTDITPVSNGLVSNFAIEGEVPPAVRKAK